MGFSWGACVLLLHMQAHTSHSYCTPIVRQNVADRVPGTQEVERAPALHSVAALAHENGARQIRGRQGSFMRAVDLYRANLDLAEGCGRLDA